MNTKRKQFTAFFWGGLVPIIAFTVIEDRFGTLWGLIAGMVFGLGEILWELKTQKKVSGLTLGVNGMILVLGGVSLVTQEGVWFKLQPALIEGAMALILWGSVILGKSLLIAMLEKQGGLPPIHSPELRERMNRALNGMTWRLGVFFAFHAVLATWAALHWSTAAWAILKGVGFTLSMVLYLVVEGLLLRYTISSTK